MSLFFFTCSIVTLPHPLFCLSVCSPRFLLLFPVQIHPLVFRMTKAEHQTMKLSGERINKAHNLISIHNTDFQSRSSLRSQFLNAKVHLCLKSLTCWSSMGWVQQLTTSTRTEVHKKRMIPK